MWQVLVFALVIQLKWLTVTATTELSRNDRCQFDNATKEWVCSFWCDCRQLKRPLPQHNAQLPAKGRPHQIVINSKSDRFHELAWYFTYPISQRSDNRFIAYVVLWDHSHSACGHYVNAERSDQLLNSNTISITIFHRACYTVLAGCLKTCRSLVVLQACYPVAIVSWIHAWPCYVFRLREWKRCVTNNPFKNKYK